MSKFNKSKITSSTKFVKNNNIDNILNNSLFMVNKHKVIIWVSTLFGLWFIPLGYLILSKDKQIKKHAKLSFIVFFIETIIILYIFVDGMVLRYL